MNVLSRRLALAGSVVLLTASAYAYFRFQDRTEEGFLTETLDRGPVV